MLLLCLVWLAGWSVLAPAASAHPLGDLTVSTHLGVRVEPAAVIVDVVVDVAEVPALRAFPALGRGPGGAQVPESDRRAYRDRLCPALLDAVRLERDGVAVTLALVGSALEFLPGDAGLTTARLECGLRTTARLETVDHELVLTDSLAVQPIGWREITAVGDGVVLVGSDVPEQSVSDALRSYPPDLLDEPLDQRSASVRVARGSGVVTGAVTRAASDDGADPTGSLTGLGQLSTSFTDLVATTRLDVGAGLVAVALAILLGALHALAPGHGKALMAAYLVGRNGSLRQAALIGVSVTLTHTAGVLLLGILLTVAIVAAPVQVYPWLSLASGLLLVAVGLGLLLRARSQQGAHVHDHDHDHDTSPGSAPVRTAVAVGGPGPTGAGPSARAHQTRRRGHEHEPVGDARGLLAVGFAGGLVPSPSALVVLLGGSALGRAWFGVLLVLAYGIGMALALVGTGLLLVRARDRLESWSAGRAAGRRTPWVPAVLSRLPTATAGLVVVIGAGLAADALRRV